MTDIEPTSETLSDFVRDRWDFLRVSAVQNAHGTWDVVLRIDGSYAAEEDCRAAADLYRRVLADALATEGIPVQQEVWYEDRFRS